MHAGTVCRSREPPATKMDLQEVWRTLIPFGMVPPAAVDCHGGSASEMSDLQPLNPGVVSGERRSWATHGSVATRVPICRLPSSPKPSIPAHWHGLAGTDAVEVGMLLVDQDIPLHMCYYGRHQEYRGAALVIPSVAE